MNRPPSNYVRLETDPQDRVANSALYAIKRKLGGGSASTLKKVGKMHRIKAGKAPWGK